MLHENGKVRYEIEIGKGGAIIKEGNKRKMISYKDGLPDTYLINRKNRFNRVGRTPDRTDKRGQKRGWWTEAIFYEGDSLRSIGKYRKARRGVNG